MQTHIFANKTKQVELMYTACKHKKYSVAAIDSRIIIFKVIGNLIYRFELELENKGNQSTVCTKRTKQI